MICTRRDRHVYTEWRPAPGVVSGTLIFCRSTRLSRGPNNFQGLHRRITPWTATALCKIFTFFGRRAPGIDNLPPALLAGCFCRIWRRGRRASGHVPVLFDTTVPCYTEPTTGRALQPDRANDVRRPNACAA